MAERALAMLLMNAALLLAMALILDLTVSRRLANDPLTRRLSTGVAVALVGVGVMLAPFEFAPGIVFDTRSVVLALSGLVFGAVPTLLAMIVTAALRVADGGLGTGVGVAVIIASGAIGIAWRYARGWHRRNLRHVAWPELVSLGFITHAVMLGLMLALPGGIGFDVLAGIGVPVLLVYPTLTLAVGMLLKRRLESEAVRSALAANEQRYRRAFEQGRLPMLLIDESDGTIVDANPAAEAFYGQPRAVLADRSVDDFADPALDAPLMQDRAANLRGERFEVRHRAADGSARVLEVFRSPLALNTRTLSQWVLIDVSERRAAQAQHVEAAERRARDQMALLTAQREARAAALNLMEDALATQARLEEALAELRESQALVAEAQRIARLGNWSISTEDMVLSWAPETSRLFGLEPAASAPTLDALLDRVVAEDRPGAVAFLEACLKGRDPGELRFRVAHADQDPRILAARARLREADAHRPQRVVGTVQDVTEQAQAEHELRKLSSALEQSPESVVITDLEGRIEYVNDAFVEVTGYARDEVLGKNPRMLQSGKTPSATFRDMWHTLKRGELWTGEFWNRRKDGTEFVEFVSITPLLDADGTVTNYVGVKEDITEKKRAAAELNAYRHHLEDLVSARTRDLAEARERAESASEAKTAFLANMSHEIRTPLNAIVSLAHLLLQGTPTPEQRDRLRKIDTAAHHLLAIVEDVLDLAKIEAGVLEFAPSEFHLSAVLDSVRSIVAGTATNKGLHVELDVHDVPMWLQGDSTRLRQAYLNLAGNAVKFTSQGTVSLRVRCLEEDLTGLWVRFEVEDTGIGIPAPRLKSVFEPFEQVERGATRRYGGTGLGLSITQRLVELMGGRVGIESREGEGTRVWFDVPLARAGERSGSPAPDAARLVARPLLPAEACVLVVEDHDINREVALELLQSFGLQAAGAENGRGALERARQKRYDLVLMDVHMPVLDGIAATRALRELPAYADVPILAMTANVLAEDREACLAAGMNDFIPKPVDPTVLRETLTEWLAGAASPTAARRERSRRLAAAPSPPTSRWDRTSNAKPPVALPSAPGLDTQRGLAALDGDAAAYVALLRRFVTAHSADARHLRSELAAADLGAARARAHGLRGVAATLGADRVATCATRLEQALAMKPEPEPTPHEGSARLEADIVALDAALSELAAALPAPQEGPKRPQRDAQALPEQVLADLLDLLVADDPAAIDLCKAHAPALRSVLGDDLDRLEQHLDGFDFPAAAAGVRHRLADAGTAHSSVGPESEA